MFGRPIRRCAPASPPCGEVTYLFSLPASVLFSLPIRRCAPPSPPCGEVTYLFPSQLQCCSAAPSAAARHLPHLVGKRLIYFPPTFSPVRPPPPPLFATF